MIIDDVVKTIKDSKTVNRPVLIGVEGFGGSGKTTFAERLSTALASSYVVNIDDFIVKEKLIESSWDKGGFDRERLEQQVLIPASAQQPVSYQELIWETNSLSKPKIVPSVDYLIVEGISSYHPDIAHYYDYKIWINTPIEVAKQRGQVRDKGNENEDKWDMWAENDLRYQRKYHPELMADFIVENSLTI
ncbi:MAG TPA: hypothetical protein VIH90_04365 [Candidatus Saccharimonadales bacterium]